MSNNYPKTSIVGNLEDLETEIPLRSSGITLVKYAKIGCPTMDVVRIWEPVNLYPTAKLQPGVSVGAFSEIGDGVEIGENTRIGAMCYIPARVTIGKNCFIGPRVTFTNDRYPPSDNWEDTVVEDGASIGAACTIICGITIGKGALIGAGSVVTCDIPPGEVWYGVPARQGKE